jgi:hypothetical protein
MYAKLFASIYQGTLRGNTHGLVVFVNLLAHADSAGWVDIHPKAIADETGLAIEQVRAAIEELEAPDPESRSPDEEGRRIVRLDEHRAWGWRIVNHAKYRAIRDESDRREQNRAAQQRWRDRQRKQNKPHQPISAQAEAEAEAEAKKEKEIAPLASLRVPPPPDFDGENGENLNGHALVRLAPGWSLPQAWGEAAERLGFPGLTVVKEAEKFKQYWTEGKGKGKRRSVKGWRQSWSTWLSKAAESTR